ncbi:hypothetical protein ASG61_23085 [Bacillus sp. Leaf75]|nr:hypothetical protein ASG61_23085 [Bacillus sp. Leaf75]
MLNLTSEQREIIATAAQQELARRSLEGFLLYDGRGMWKTAKHLKMLISELEKVERNVKEGKGDRLLIFMPPRHGKSEVSTKKFPAWVLMRNPTWEMIISSYSADLAFDFSKIARDTFKEHAQTLYNVNVSRESGAVGRWGIEGYRGGLAAAGVGGPLTGRGAHIAIIDDPFKNWQEADSLKIRENVDSWYRSTLRTRLAPGGAVILIMTRWHDDDLAGRLIKDMESDGEKWRVLSLPAIAEDEDDALGRKVGATLWPERFPEQEYHNTKKALGSRLWNAMYQQRPSPAGGNIFKRHWWKFYVPDEETRARLKLPKEVAVLPKMLDKQVQSWDCTFKDSSASDFVVGQVWGKRQANSYLLDQIRDRLNLPETMKAIRNMTAKWPNAKAKYVEDKANGPAVIQMLQDEISGLIPVNPEGGKEVRANAVSPEVESGNVYLPHPSYAPWVNELIDEATAFPNGKHDDMVDSLTQALVKLQASKGNPLDRYKKLMGR